MISKTSKLGIWAATAVIAAGVLLSVPPAVIAQVPVIGSLVQGFNAHFGNLVVGANGLNLAAWTNEGFTQGSWLSFNNNGGSNGETDFINYHPSLTGGFDWFTPNTGSLGSSVMHLSPAGTLTVAQVNGNAATATALAGSLGQCANGATGITNAGNAICVAAASRVQSAFFTTNVCTTAGAELSCTSPTGGGFYTWPSAFATSTYNVACNFVGAPTGTASHPGLYGPYVVGQNTTGIQVTIQAGSNSAGGNNTVGGFYCLAQGS